MQPGALKADFFQPLTSNDGRYAPDHRPLDNVDRAGDVPRGLDGIAGVSEEVSFRGREQDQAIRSGEVRQISDVGRGGDEQRVDLFLRQLGRYVPATLFNFRQSLILA